MAQRVLIRKHKFHMTNYIHNMEYGIVLTPTNTTNQNKTKKRLITVE